MEATSAGGGIVTKQKSKNGGADHASPCAGDVILTRSEGKVAPANLAFQKKTTSMNACYTHVAICIGPYVIVDATPGDGVKMRNILDDDEWKKLNEMMRDNRFRVWRSKKIWESDENTEKLRQSLHLIIEKGYNYFFGASHPANENARTLNSESLFCSQLVYLLLCEFDVLSKKLPQSSSVYPVHFENLSEDAPDGNWKNITEGWRNHIEYLNRKRAEYDFWRESARLYILNMGFAALTEKLRRRSRESRGQGEGPRTLNELIEQLDKDNENK